LLREIASHGFIAIANGSPSSGVANLMGMANQTKMSAIKASIDWVMAGAAGGKFGEVDTSKIAAAGQSCGGLEAYSASYHDDRVKATILLNSGVIDEPKVYLLSELKAPVALFNGGPLDVAYANVSFFFLFLNEDGTANFRSRPKEIGSTFQRPCLS
jgi:dienelactone hydrolase